jgi:CD109 antigen
VTFNPPEPLKAGMVVVDVAVPTGFEPVRESIEEAVAGEPQMKRFDVAGRKVIFYIEDMEPGDSISFSFQARALYPVRAKGVASQAYSYYNPEWRGETLGEEIAVSGGGE